MGVGKGEKEGKPKKRRKHMVNMHPMWELCLACSREGQDMHKNAPGLQGIEFFPGHIEEERMISTRGLPE